MEPENKIKVYGMIDKPEWHRLMKVVLDDSGISTTINTCGGGNLEPKVKTGDTYRKLTPKECWRLMGFYDSDFNRAKDGGVSNSQLYKQAGNSIVVNVLESIFKQMLKEEPTQNENG